MAPRGAAAAPGLRPLRSPLALALGVLVLARVPAAHAVAPALGLFTGPLGLVLAALALGLGLSTRLRPRSAGVPAWALLVLPFLLFGALGQRYARAVEPSGDEIDYLLMAQSVWREGDVDLRDNFARGDHLEYLGGLDRMPAGVADGRGGLRPTHSPGVALLLAPAYALAGRAGCVLLLALAGAALAWIVHGLALEATGSEPAAALAWLATLGPPVLFYTAFLYTEVVAALALALALRALRTGPAAGSGRAALAALALACLPWLHVRLALAAAATGLAALAVLRGRARIAFAATGGAMALAWAAYQWWAFGSLSPFARYGGSAPTPVLRATPLRTLVGLFVDGAYGLLPFAPVFLLALAGLPALRRRRHWPLAAAALGLLLPVLGWRNWWGFSPPARFVVPLVPVLALALALRLAEAPARGLARWRLPLAAAGLALALLMFAAPREMQMVTGRDGPPAVFESLAGSVSPSRYLPFLSSRARSSAPPWEPPASEAEVAAIWLVALAVLLALDWRARHSERVDRWFAGLALPLLLLLAVSLAVERVRPGGAPSSSRDRPAAAVSGE